MKYTVWLFDDTYQIINDMDYHNGIADVELAMIEKTPIRLGRTLVAGSSISRIEPFGNPEDYGSHNAQLGSGFDRAAELLESGRPAKKSLEKNIAETRKNLQKIVGETDDMAQYRAARLLANNLHDTSGWGLAEWDNFNREHPNPVVELAEWGKVGQSGGYEH